LLPDPVLHRVQTGDYYFKVVPADPVRFRENYSRPFWEASAANDGKYDLDAATCGLREKATGKAPDYYFGYPFPTIDRNDPEAGCKIAWNFPAANYMGGGTGATVEMTGLDTTGSYRVVRAKIKAVAFTGRAGGPVPNPERTASKALTVGEWPSDF